MINDNDKGLYFKWLNDVTCSDSRLDDLRQYAQLNNIPIIQDEGIVFLKQLMALTKSKRILEIGSAIGYSAITLALIDPSIHITTIERDPEMVEKARYYINLFDLNKQIDLIEADALLMDLSLLHDTYDLLFIDAAKSQYQVFFEKYTKRVKQDGIIITDNLIFHELIFKPTIKNRSLRQLITKIKNYNTWLRNNEDYSTVFYPIGDGIAVSIKK